MPTSTPAPAAPAAALALAAAVAALAAALGLHHAVARRVGRHYHIAYAWGPGPLTHLDPARCPRTALLRYERALGHDYAAIH